MLAKADVSGFFQEMEMDRGESLNWRAIIRAFFSIARWRRTVWAELIRRKLPIVVFIQSFEGLRRAFNFLGGNCAVVVGIQSGNQWRDGSLFARWRIFWSVVVIGWRRHAKFFKRDNAVLILIEFSNDIGCGFDLVFGQFSIAIGVDHRK